MWYFKNSLPYTTNFKLTIKFILQNYLEKYTCLISQGFFKI